MLKDTSFTHYFWLHFNWNIIFDFRRRTTVARVDSPLIREPTPEPIYCTAHHNTCCDADSLYDSHICQPSTTYDHFFGGFGPKNVLHFRSKRDSFPDYVDQKKQLRTDNSVNDVDQLADRETVYHNDAAYSEYNEFF